MNQTLSPATRFLGALVLTTTLACGDDSSATPDGGSAADAASTADATDVTNPPTSYEFESRFVAGESSVSYSGQVFRQLLIAELNAYVSTLTSQVDTTPPADDAILAGLNFYFDFDSTISGTTPLATVDGMTPSAAQATFDDVSTDKNIRSKLAGNDSATDHTEWNTVGNFLGWSEGGEDTDTPTELVQYWFRQLDDLAFDRINGAPLDPAGNPIANVYVTPEGHDLQQLIQKFLLGAVTFSQGQDDYLDNDVADKGLLSSNAQDADKTYSKLEHAWDEGFGYFGAARNYGEYTDEELSSKGGRPGYQGYNDADSNGSIDLLGEFNFGVSTNCAKRDRGSSAEAPTNFTKEVFDALLAGRQIIASAGETLTDQELADLVAQRDIASSVWEECVAATVVHYVNEVLADTEKFGTEEYNFADHAKHWSELKGFALGLQFNPRSPMLTGSRFVDFHTLIGDAPVLPNDAGGQTAIDQYKLDLQAASVIARDAYGFAQANVDVW